MKIRRIDAMKVIGLTDSEIDERFKKWCYEHRPCESCPNLTAINCKWRFDNEMIEMKGAKNDSESKA